MCMRLHVLELDTNTYIYIYVYVDPSIPCSEWAEQSRVMWRRVQREGTAISKVMPKNIPKRLRAKSIDFEGCRSLFEARCDFAALDRFRNLVATISDDFPCFRSVKRFCIAFESFRQLFKAISSCRNFSKPLFRSARPL